MLDVEYPHIICCADYSAIARVGHELDREDIGSMSRYDRRSEVELLGRRFGLIGMDVDAVVVRARGKEAAGFRPTNNLRCCCSVNLMQGDVLPDSVNASIVTFQLVYDVKIVNPLAVAVYRADVRAFVALLADLPLEQAIVDCVLHVGWR